MSLGMILIVILILLVIFGLPNWGYSQHWGGGWHVPGGLGLVLIIVLVLVLLGKL